MLSNDDLVTKIAYGILVDLMEQFPQNDSVTIIEDNQDAPRPVSSKGYMNNYLFFKVLPLKQVEWPSGNMIDSENQRLTAIRQMTITLNALGTLANDVSNYLTDAIASVQGDIAFDREGVKIYFNGITDPIDLTSIENKKWVKRVQRDLILGFQDTNDFRVGSFKEVEATLKIDNGITQKVMIIKPKGD